MELKYRGDTRKVIAIDPNDIIYPKKITLNSPYIFVGWKKWNQDYFKNSTKVEYLPLELGRLIRYKLITREEHNTIISMLRSEDMENVYMAHRLIEGQKNKRHGRL